MATVVILFSLERGAQAFSCGTSGTHLDNREEQGCLSLAYSLGKFITYRFDKRMIDTGSDKNVKQIEDSKYLKKISSLTQF